RSPMATQTMLLPGKVTVKLDDWGNHALSTDNDFADLDHRAYVGIVCNVGHDLLGVRPEAGLERLNRVTKDVAHSHIGCGSSGCSARKSFVDGVILAGIAHARLHERHVLVAIILVVEACALLVGVHNADLDHGCSLV